MHFINLEVSDLLKFLTEKIREIEVLENRPVSGLFVDELSKVI